MRGGLIRVNETVPLSADLVPNDIVIDKWEKRAYVTLLVSIMVRLRISYHKAAFPYLQNSVKFEI